MNLSIEFNTCIDQCNFLKAPTTAIDSFFHKYPTLFKIALVINHLFRASMMVGLMFIPSVSPFVIMPFCLVGSLFYRLTVEKNCAFKFALPALAGALAFMLALPAVIQMINGIAFTSALSGFIACVSLLPIVLYGAYVLLSVNYDVDKAVEKRNNATCCTGAQ